MGKLIDEHIRVRKQLEEAQSSNTKFERELRQTREAYSALQKSQGSKVSTEWCQKEINSLRESMQEEIQRLKVKNRELKQDLFAKDEEISKLKKKSSNRVKLVSEQRSFKREAERMSEDLRIEKSNLEKAEKKLRN